jgi:hypothetical protein
MRKTIILRAALLLAAFTVAEVSSAVAKPKQTEVTSQACENSASSCLEMCWNRLHHKGRQSTVWQLRCEMRREAKLLYDSG